MAESKVCEKTGTVNIDLMDIAERLDTLSSRLFALSCVNLDEGESPKRDAGLREMMSALSTDLEEISEQIFAGLEKNRRKS